MLQRSQNLRRVLLEAIRAMRPEPGTPARSLDWRAYRILEQRYIEGLSPAEVMDRLTLGRSQYFRDQSRVLEALADTLWNRWQAEHEARPDEKGEAATREDLIQSETERLCAHATWETVDAVELLEELRGVIEPLARAKDVTLRFGPLHHLMLAYVDRVMLRQAVLNLVTYALDVARGGQVTLADFSELGEMGVRVTIARPEGAAERQGLGLNVCRQLMTAMGGRLDLAADRGGRWEARLVWPVTSLCTLLVVDDNEGLIELFRRYLSGTHWQVAGATSVSEAREVIAEAHPTVIALDVMMPEEDGWEFLMALQAGEETRGIPVIICSVLNEPQLALELGAQAYLEKPVSRQALLRALVPWSRSAASRAPAH